MNILHTYTRRALGKNRVRTWVTIIGIVLSMALLTAVIEGAYSGLSYTRGIMIEDGGYYHAYYYNLDEAQMRETANLKFIDERAMWQMVGWEVQDADAERMPLFVEAIDEKLPDMLSLKLIEGRLPENEHELIVSSRFYDAYGANHDETALDAFQIGNTVTMTLGTRVDGNGNVLSEREYDEEAHVIDAKPYTYTIVGVYNGFNTILGGEGYRALTRGSGTGAYNVFFTVNHPYFLRSIMRNQTLSRNWGENTQLMRLYGSFSDMNLSAVLFGFAAILVILVMFGSISLIYNAFSISVAERTRQFGILKSIGATKKQIRASVRYEALLLCAVGIPIGLIVGCVGIGVTLWAIKDTFIKLAPNIHTEMKLVLHPLALLTAVLCCLVTVLISASVPAKRAARLQPIDAIRQSTDVKAKPKEVKTSKLTEKLFGFEGAMGAKNFKRNKKGYRITVLSLVMSIVLFIGASSFTTYLTDMVRTLMDDNDADVVGTVKIAQVDALFNEIKASEEVTRASYYFVYYGGMFGMQTDSDNLSDSYWSAPHHRREGDREDVNVSVLYLDDESFRALCKENHIDAERYFDPDCPYGLLKNEVTDLVRVSDNRQKRYQYEVFRIDVLPASVDSRDVPERKGFYKDLDYDPEYGDIVRYYPSEYIEEQVRRANTENRGMIVLDSSMAAETLTVEEASVVETFPFDALVAGNNFNLAWNNRALIVYPFSKCTLANAETDQAYMMFESDDHKATRNRLYEAAARDDRLLVDYVGDLAEERENSRMIVGVVNVFSYGFIILISLIAAANVFNTISTSIMLRRREFAMLKSIGMGDRGMLRMLNYECLIYGLRALLIGLPISALVTFAIFKVVAQELERSFYMPWISVVIAVLSVFIVVFATMLYARSKVKKDNPVDALKNENL